MDKDKDKFKEYIDLCVPSFLIKMKDRNDKSYFFKAHPSGTDKDPAYKEGRFRFTIANIDNVGDETTHNYREINLNKEFGNLESLKAVIIPEHKDMYKDIVTEEMKVDCGKDNCGGDALKKEDVVPNVPQGVKTKSSLPTGPIDLTPGRQPRVTKQEEVEGVVKKIQEAQKRSQEEAPITEQSSEGFGDARGQGGGGKNKKKRRKKSSRSKKRRNKRKNRTKKN